MRAAAALLLALAFAAPASAQSRSIEELTSNELRDRVAAGATTVLIPIGGTEQNGAHIALGKHNVRAKILAGRIAERLGNALVAPVVAYVPEGSIDPPTGHMRHPGTITVPEKTFESLLESAARSFRHHGFRDVVFLGDHGDYQKNLKAVAARLNKEWASTPARAHAIEEYYRAAGIIEHAGTADTSLTLALDPSLVRAPGGASAEAGRAVAERIVARSVESIGKAVAHR